MPSLSAIAVVLYRKLAAAAPSSSPLRLKSPAPTRSASARPIRTP